MTDHQTAPALSPRDFVVGADEPRIADLRLAERLGFEQSHSIRKLIVRNKVELLTYGQLVGGVSPVSVRGSFHGGKNPKGGRPGVAYFLNEGQCLVVCALSRTPMAAAARREIIDVYMAFRHGWSVEGSFLGMKPITPAERLALRDICDLGHIFRETGRPYLIAPVTRTILDTLAAFEADVEDAEDGDPAEFGGDDEESLGWAAGMSQRKLGINTEDGDSTAPETHGKGFRRSGPDDHEPEAGYDLPEGDEEFDGPGEDAEPSLGAPNNHHNQNHWAQGSSSDRELVNEDGIAKDSDGIDWQAAQANVAAARDMERKADAIRRRKDTRPTVGHVPVYEIQDIGVLRLVTLDGADTALGGGR